MNSINLISTPTSIPKGESYVRLAESVSGCFGVFNCGDVFVSAANVNTVVSYIYDCGKTVLNYKTKSGATAYILKSIAKVGIIRRN